MKNIITLLVALFFIVCTTLAQQVEREMVVLEIGTGTWCPYCPGAAMGADDLVSNGHDVAVIEYHNGDDYTNTASNARNNYYNVPGYPTANFDGTLTYVGGSASQSLYPTYLPRYNQRKSINSSFTIDIEGESSGLIDFNIDITVIKVASFSGGNLVLQVAVTESHIPKFWQGMNELNFVERMMVPNHIGTSLDFSGNDTINLNFIFSLEEGWDTENCELVVFIQDNSTKEIQQGAKRDMMSFGNVNDYDVALTGVSNLLDKLCHGELEPKVVIRNNGNENLTFVDINYYVNGSAVSTYQWTGNIPFLESEEVLLPPINFIPEEENELVIYSSDPNGNPDQYPINDTIHHMIEEAEVTPAIVKLIMRTDSNPEETTWEITDTTGNVLYQGGPYSQASQMIMDTFELSPNECYQFTIYDSGGDGFIIPGFYSLYYGNNTSISQGTSFGYNKAVQFFTDNNPGIIESDWDAHLKIYPNPARDIAMISFTMKQNDYVSVRIFNLLGEVVYSRDNSYLSSGKQVIQISGENLSPGIYFVHLRIGNQGITEKMSIFR
ncbi:MAG: T9SS type A sorting domain-containing protein [Bacteroidetes bacterium]|nr:T9SS type A sorting domain-containing protein [Bacteroidota bacterium]